MAAHRIVCTEQTGCNYAGHIIAIGVVGTASTTTQRLTVAEAWTAIDRGEVFYTSDTRGNVALVEKYYCGCKRGSLRSKPDTSVANNLDSLGPCRW